jgi:general stress protein CsbA
LTPGFFPKTDANVLFELVVVLFSISSFGYIMTALQFIAISTNPLWLYKSLDDMKKDFTFSQYLVVLFTVIFLGSVAVLAYSERALLMTTVAVIGIIGVARYLITDRWALAKRPPPRKKGN